MFRKEDPSNIKIEGKKHISPKNTPSRHLNIGKRMIIQSSASSCPRESHIRINIPPHSEVKKLTWNQTLEEDFKKIWRKVNPAFSSNHKYWSCIYSECHGLRSNFYLDYGKYGGELYIDKSLKIIDKGTPEDALDFICYLRDQHLHVNKKLSIECSIESCRLLSLHHRLKSFDSKQYAKSIIQSTKERFGYQQKASLHNKSSIIFG